MTEISLKTKITRDPDAAWRILGGHLIAITPRDNRVHKLNPTGVFLWKCLEEGPQEVAAVARRLEETFDTGGADPAADLLPFVRDLAEKGLLRTDG